MSLRTLTRAAAALVVLAAPLGACGKLGELEKPGPLNGAGRATTRQADEAQRQAQDPQRPVDTVDPRDRTIDPAPPRAAPIEGSGQNPFGSAARRPAQPLHQPAMNHFELYRGASSPAKTCRWRRSPRPSARRSMSIPPPRLSGTSRCCATR